MTDSNHDGAPVPVGDVVPGDPPVPITVWPVPAPQRDETLSDAMGVRLVHNLTHRSDLIIDLTQGPQLAHAITAARRRRHLLGARLMGWGSGVAMLIVTGWPLTRGAGAGTRVEFFARCRAKLLPGGCLAVLLGHDDPAFPTWSRWECPAAVNGPEGSGPTAW
ncbi:hypothetical protein [Micromonospora sp. WMMD812]|uniref:hypothetical protein n=1 Tax=Micromonospora sp. WMMD812 TaxID=3015152 RepID=UPI00248AFE6E|nr:hypothetical protein [Micromonospora sp. WMMD812]WBB69157.1 hypothetical protein O7603_07360 [Micromonospora sp. WMMD812]